MCLHNKRTEWPLSSCESPLPLLWRARHLGTMSIFSSLISFLRHVRSPSFFIFDCATPPFTLQTWSSLHHVSFFFIVDVISSSISVAWCCRCFFFHIHPVTTVIFVVCVSLSYFIFTFPSFSRYNNRSQPLFSELCFSYFPINCLCPVRVLEAGPWSIMGNCLTLQKWEARMRIEDVRFDEPEVWLQIYGLAHDQATENNAG